MKKTDFFIVGAPKCGTTTLFRALEQHPEIFVCSPKEPMYFCAELFPEKKESPKSLQAYMDLFREGKDKLCGEGSTWNLFSKTAAKRIYDFNPNARILIMIRNPIDFLCSLHNQRLKNGTEKESNFETAISKSENKEIYFESAKFSEQIRRYFDVFGRENCKVVVFDDFIRDSSLIYKEILIFIGVKNTSFEPSFKVYAANRQIKNTFLYQLFKHPPSWIFKLGRKLTPPFLSSTKRKVAWALIRTGINILAPIKTRPPLNPEFREQLKKKFRPEVVELSRLLERDLIRDWNYRI